MQESKKKGSGMVFFLLAFFNIVVMIPYLGPAAVLTTLVADLNIPSTMTAYVVSIYLIMCGVFMFGGSVIGNKIGFKNTWWLGMVAITVGLAISAASPNFAVYFIGRLISGVGFGISMSAMNPIAGIWFQGAKFTAFQTATSALSCIGVAGAFIVFPLFSSWRTATWAFACITLVYTIASIIWVKYPEGYAAILQAPKNSGATKSKPKFGFVFKNKDFMLILIINIVSMCANTVLLTFMSSYFLKEANMAQGTASTVSSLMTFIQIVGAILGGILVGKSGHRKVFMVVGTGLYGLCGIGLVLFGHAIALVVTSAIMCGIAFYLRMPAMGQYFIEETDKPDPDVIAAAAAITTGSPMLINLVASPIAALMVSSMGYGKTILIWHIASLLMIIPALFLNEVGPKSARSKVRDAQSEG